MEGSLPSVLGSSGLSVIPCGNLFIIKMGPWYGGPQSFGDLGIGRKGLWL